MGRHMDNLIRSLQRQQRQAKRQQQTYVITALVLLVADALMWGAVALREPPLWVVLLVCLISLNVPAHLWVAARWNERENDIIATRRCVEDVTA